MKSPWVGSEETLWNKAQHRTSLQCELNSRIPMTVSHVTSEHQNDAGGVESLSQPGPYMTFDWKLIFLKKAFLFLFCLSDALKWKLHAALPPSKEIAEQSQILLLDDTSCWRWERVNLVILCKDWGLQTGKLWDVVCSIVDVKTSRGKQMRNLCLPNKKREDRPQETTGIEYFAGISLIFPG